MSEIGPYHKNRGTQPHLYTTWASATQTAPTVAKSGAKQIERPKSHEEYRPYGN